MFGSGQDHKNLCFGGPQILWPGDPTGPSIPTSNDSKIWRDETYFFEALLAPYGFPMHHFFAVVFAAYVDAMGELHASFHSSE
jgi:hypothetical protein